MDAAWYNHNPVDGNMGMETLTKLDRTVEATRVAVAHVLQISGDAVEIEREADLSALVTTHDEDLAHDGSGRNCQRNDGGSGAGQDDCRRSWKTGHF